MRFAAWISVFLVLFGAGMAALTFLKVGPQASSHIVVATGGSEGIYNDLAKVYQADLKTYGIELDLRPDLDGFYTLKALVVDGSAQAGFVKGGFVGGQQGRLSTDVDRAWYQKDVGALQSVGRLFVEPIWVFTRKADRFGSLRELKGKTIFIGTKASGVRIVSGRLLKASGVDATNSKLIEDELPEDGASLIKGDIDAAILLLPPDSGKLQALLRNPAIHLMNFTTEADAYVNRFSYLSKVVLHQGAVELSPDIPESDLTLLTTEAAFVVRRDLNPSIVTLLTHAMLNNPKSGTDRSGDPILFYRAGAFPSLNDPEFDLAPETKAFQTSHDLPFLLREAGPLVAKLGLPFSVTAFINEHGSQFLILLVPLLTVLIPLIRIAPAIYNWSGRRRLLYWYRRLKALEGRLSNKPDLRQITAARQELENIELAVSKIRVPLAFSSQLYDLRLHINLVRQRLTPGAAPNVFGAAASAAAE
jgi:uncharacterized protein